MLKLTATIIAAIAGVIIVPIVLNTCGTATGLVHKTINQIGTVADKEVLPEAVNRKYNWFKDAAGQITAQQSSLVVLQSAVKSARASVDRNPSRSNEERLAQREGEYSGAVASFNRLVGEYNAEMSKWHTQFTNFGGMPHGWEAVTPSKFPEFRTE